MQYNEALLTNSGSNGVFYGYAAVFEILDSQGDIIKRGAVSKNKNNFSSNVRLLWQHDYKQPIGVIKLMKEDSYGLYIGAHLVTEVAKANEAYILLKHGAINGLSIGYRAISHHTDKRTGIRSITEIELLEISLVTFPANKFAKIANVKREKSTKELLSEAQNAISGMIKFTQRS